MNVRDDDDLDGEGDDDDGHHCLHSKKVVCGLANFSRTYRDQIFTRIYFASSFCLSQQRPRGLLTRWVADSEVCSPGGSPSDLHDLRSPPTLSDDSHDFYGDALNMPRSMGSNACTSQWKI